MESPRTPLFEQVTLIIVSYFSASKLEHFLLQDDIADLPKTIIDNSNCQDTYEVCTNTPNTEYIYPNGNIGYGRANNIGIKKCLTPYALIINPDVTITRDVIANLVNTLIINKNCAMSAPVVSDKSSRGDDIFLNLSNTINSSGNELSVNWASGCCLCIDTSMLIDEIGLFNENFFMFYEETELQQRIINNKKDILVLKNIKIQHLTGTSTTGSEKIKRRRDWHTQWSKLYYTEITKGRSSAISEAIKFMILRIPENIFHLTKSCKRATTLTKYHACFSYLYGVKAFKPDRLNPII